jgi:GAF domain-containing protein
MSAAPDSMLSDPQQVVSDLRRQLADANQRLEERTAERDEALAQQAATAEVLQVINSSPGDLAPVFDAMLEKAMRLCQAAFGELHTYDGERFSPAALRGVPAAHVEFRKSRPMIPGPGTMNWRIRQGLNVVHVADLKSEEPYQAGEPQRRALVNLGGARTGLAVALRNDQRLLGLIIIYRQEVRPFSDKQITLLQNFAAQAVIAMENARLITETREALEQQTATAEVLQVINASPGDLAPVFEAMLEKALRLCEAAFGFLWTWDGEQMHRQAFRGVPDELLEQLREPLKPPPRSIPERIINGERVVSDLDVLEGPRRSPILARLGARSCVGVALRKDNKLLGGITIYRGEVRPFAEKQLALLQNFAVQAVIAMENARLITETREALEQQTATTEVLQVINSSPGDLAPVFDSMLEKATRLCDAAFGVFLTYDGERLHTTAVRNATLAYTEFLTNSPHRPGPNDIHARLIKGESFVQFADVKDSLGYRMGDPMPRAFVELGGGRTVLAVSLRKDDKFLGEFAVYRREVRPFTDKQVSLLQNFAAQAVIAMENARLITETREALEQQTATAEVLGVINASPGNLTPVFEAMLDKATTLCNAAFGIMLTWDGECMHRAAYRGASAELIEALREPQRATPGSHVEQLVSGERIICATDIREQRAYRAGARGIRAVVDIGGARSFTMVALHKDGALLGAIAAYRREIQPFTDKQIALLQNFAAQAVIAMENARLITETREALEQQTATAEVLGVINSSPGDLAPVFDAILEKAHSLCGIAVGSLNINEGGMFRAVAARGMPDSLAAVLREPFEAVPGSPPYRLLNGERIVHADMAEMAKGLPDVRRAQASAQYGLRTVLFVPLRKEAALLGYISAFRKEVRPFADKEISVLENFAAQAVIAMENARLITETRERTRDLQESLEYQTATSDVLKVISRSDADLEAVLENLVETATRLCQADHGYVFRRHGEHHHLIASFGVDPDFRNYMIANPFLPDRGTLSGRVALERQIVHIDDAATDVEYTWSEAQQLGNLRSGLGVPLLREDTLLGIIVLYRSRVERFTDKQIALAATFGDQAVIAIENARLLGELRGRTRDLQESLEYQTATSDVLKVISQSTFDLQPVLETVAETAARLCDSEIVTILRRQGEVYRVAAAQGWSPEYRAFLENHPFSPDDRGTLTGRVVQERRAIHVTDVTADPEYTLSESVTLGNARTQLGVPLLREGFPIGVIIVSRQRVQPFTPKQIELVTTFADQAVIAIENTRLLTELRESLEQQQAIAEVLGVINSSPGELDPVFEAMLEKAIRLCEASFGVLAMPDEGESFKVIAMRGVPPELAAYFRDPLPAHPGTGVGRVMRGENIVHILDSAAEETYAAGVPARRAIVDLGGVRTQLNAALRKDDNLLGIFNLWRREVRPFTEKQIALVQSFAAQAVIAMDNARLLNEIRQRQAELRVTFDNMGDGVAMFDAELRLAAWNMNFERILDLPEAFLGERPSYRDYIRHLAERGEFGTEDVEGELSRRLQSTDEELRLERTRPDGRVIEVRRNTVPGGGFVFIYSDITERKRAEAEIRAARDAAEKALIELQTAQASLVHAQKMAALGQLTAGIAHEIKNPLNFVNNFAGLSVELLDELKEETAPAIAALDKDKQAAIDETIEMITSNLEKIAEHGKRADGIVKSMLDHSRGGTGDWRPVDLNGLIDEALNLAYHGARAQDQSFNITMERDLDRDLAPIEVVPQDMTRVFLNLFSNGFYAASKRQREAIDGFRPVLKVRTRDVGDQVEIRVRDNGTGIAPEIRDKLFQPFVTTKPTGEGTGLGLSISYDIVTQQHGGSITVESEPGEYTEFTVRLPRRRHSAAPGRAA